MKRALLLVVVAACTDSSVPATEATSDVAQATTVCGTGPTVKGIDISYYQGTIDWKAVAGDGVVYAFIRTSDGSYHDPNFDANWSGSRAAGVKHGAYHFFRPEDDAVAQADYVLSKIGGKLEADDLPPVLDVEAADGVSAATLAAGVKAWSDHIYAKLGKKPIIYTGMYFWRDSVGNPDMHDNPLWHAQYTTASCPNIATSWPTWTFWQYTSTGSIAGISGNVDVDRFNGDDAAFKKLLGPAGPCGTIDAAGGVIDNASDCYTAGGPATGIRHVSTSGMDDNLDWTHTTALAYEQNFAQWDLYFAQPGSYQIEVYTSATFAQSKKASYQIVASGDMQEKLVDQTAVDGWQTLGTFTFAQGGDQFIHLGDNTGEAEADNVQLVFDAVRITPAADMGSGSGSDDSTDPMMKTPAGGGCSTNGGAGGGALLALALVGLVRRRR